MEIRSNVRKGSDVINLIKLGIKDIMIYLGIIKIYPIIPINNAVVTCDSTVYNRKNLVALNIIVTLNGTTLVEYRDYVVSANAGGTNVGTYTVTVKGIDLYGGTANGTFIITKAPPTYTVPTAKTLTYTGSPQALLNGGYSSDGIILYSTDNSTWSASIPTGTDANTYTTYWRFIGDGGNFYDKSSESLSTTISKANQAAPVATGATTIYNNPAVATASGGGGHGVLEWTNGNTQSSIGSKTTKVRWSGDSNYNASLYSNEVTITMDKRTGVVTINGISTPYDGNVKALATVSGNSGTMHYSTDQTNWSTNIPTATNAGSWKIYWYMDGTDYYYGIEASSSRYVSASITLISLAAPIAVGASVNYHNTATATASGGGGIGTLTWTNGNTRTAVGTTTTAAYWSGNNNYSASPNSNSVDLIVNKATDQSITVTLTNRTYNTNSQIIASASSHGISSYYLGLGSSNTSAPTSWGSANTSLSVTNAGIYYIWYKGTADENHNGDISATYKGTVTVSKANQAAPITNDVTTTYNTIAVATASGGGGQGSLEWSNGNTQTSVGSKTTKARWSGNNNYNASDWSNEITLTMNKASGSISTAPTNSNPVYASGDYLCTEGSGTGTMLYKLGNGSYSSTRPTTNGLNAGSYTLYYKVSASTNYNESSESSITVTIAKASLSAPTATGASVTYGNTATATATGGGGYGTLEWSNGNTLTGNVGSKTTKARWSGNTNYNPSDYSNEVTLAITRANLSNPSVSMNNWTYGNTASTPSVSGNSGNGTVTYSYKVSTAADSTYTSTKPCNAGTYTVRAVIGQTTNYNGTTVTTNFTISKANLSSASVSMTGWEYGSTASDPSVSGNSGGGSVTYSYKVSTAADSTYTSIKPSTVGTYTVRAIIAETSNYNGATLTNTFSISKKSLSNASVSMSGWTYGETASTPSVSGNIENGSVTYSYKVSGAADSTYSSTKPSNAGTYVVRAVIAETSNYSGATVTNAFTISKANLSASVSMSGWTYGDSATNPSVSGNSGSGSITYHYKVNGAADSTYTTTKPSDAGTYVVRAVIAETTNYNGTTVTNTFTIAKADLSAPTATGSTVTYGNTATATATGGGNHGTLEWNNGNTLTGNVGSKVTKVRWSGDSNYEPSPYSNEVTLAITKANQSAPTAVGASVIYGNTATATASGGGGQGSLEWSNGSTLTGNVGSKTTKARWAGNSNYNASSWSNEVTLSITKADLSAPSVSGSSTTYPTTATASASGSGYGSIEWESAQSQTSVGSHTTRARWTGNSNYNASPWSGYVTVSMGKASQSAPTASGSSVNLGSSACASASGGGEQGSIEWSNGQCRTATGSQSTQARWSGNGNYDASPWSNSVTLTVTDPYNGHTYTDLGLSVNWATTNLGASDPHDIGSFYKYGLGANTYSNSQADYEGREDPLDASVDSATQTWGPHWRTPTEAEWIEFANNCTFETIFIDGQEYLRCHANNTYIDLPVTGYYEDGAYDDNSRGYYWTSSPNGSAEAIYARCNGNITTYRDARKCGFLIRPVAV